MPTDENNLSGSLGANFLFFKNIRKWRLVIPVALPGKRTYLLPSLRRAGGEPMSDRITALDVQSQKFDRKMRGYDPEAVDMCLRSLAEELERLNLENGSLREELGEAKRGVAEYRDREKVLQETLVSAQKMTDEMKATTKSESDLIVREARMKAERLLSDAQDQLGSIEVEIGKQRLERDRFETRLKSMIEEHMTLIELRREERAEMDNLHFIKRRSGSEAAG